MKGGPPTARHLREIRIERGWSLDHLAETSGISKGILSLIERGRLMASPKEANAIADALELPRDSLVVRGLLVCEAEK